MTAPIEEDITSRLPSPLSSGIWGKALRFALGSTLSLLVAGIIATNAYKVDDEVNPQLGVVLKAGECAWNHLEGDGQGYWTSNGVRRTALPTPSDGASILLVGNSYTEGLQVTDEEHYGHLLENALRQKKKYIPVLTYGKSGASVADYVASASVLQEIFKPQWTIIQLDERDFRERAWGKVSPGEATFLRGDGQARIKVVVQPLPKTIQKSLPRRLAERFPNLVPYSLVYRRLQEFRIWLRTEKPWFRPVASKGVHVPAVGQPAPGYPVEEEMRMLAEAYRHRLTLLYLPRFDPKEFSHRTVEEMIFRKLAAKEGIRFVSLGDKFDDFARSGRAPYGFNNTEFNFGHWNRYGHEAAAQLLLDDLLRMGL